MVPGRRLGSPRGTLRSPLWLRDSWGARGPPRWAPFLGVPAGFGCSWEGREGALGGVRPPSWLPPTSQASPGGQPEFVPELSKDQGCRWACTRIPNLQCWGMGWGAGPLQTPGPGGNRAWGTRGCIQGRSHSIAGRALACLASGKHQGLSLSTPVGHPLPSTSRSEP